MFVNPFSKRLSKHDVRMQKLQAYFENSRDVKTQIKHPQN